MGFGKVSKVATTAILALVLMVVMAGSASAISEQKINVIVENGELVAGMYGQSLGLLIIEDSNATSVQGDHALGGKTKIILPDGLTFNQTAAPVESLIVSATGSLDVVDYYYEGTNTFVVEHSKSSDDGDQLRIYGLVVDVAPDATASGTGASTSVKIVYAIGSEDLGILKVYKPQASGGGGEVTAGKPGQELSPLTITTNGVNGQIGNNTYIYIYAPTDKGITFDKSQTLQVSPQDTDLVNVSAVEITDSYIKIPVTKDWSAGDSITIGTDLSNGKGPKVNVTADAQSGGKLTVKVYAKASTGVVEADVSDVDTITVNKPEVTVSAGEYKLALGKNSQYLGNANIVVKIKSVTQGDIGANTNVTIKLNVTDVTFDKSADVKVYKDNDGQAPWDTEITGVYINDTYITVNVTDNAPNKDQYIVFTGIKVNVSASAQAGEKVMVIAETQSEPTAPIIVSEDSQNLFTIVAPEITYGGDTIKVDKDGVTEKGIKDIVVKSADDGDIAKDTNVTIKLDPKSGVTFDKSATTVTVTGTGNLKGQLDQVYVNDTYITVRVKADAKAGDTITFSGIKVNVSASAVNVTPVIETNTSDNVIAQNAPNNITIDHVLPDKLYGWDNDANGWGPEGNNQANADVTVTGLEVGQTVTGKIRLTYSDNGDQLYGGQQVNLTIVSVPTGATGYALNTTTVTTGSDGVAAFNIKLGDKAGDYVVNVTVPGTNLGINITFKAESAEAVAVDLVKIRDAIYGEDGDIGKAAILVLLKDKYGNNVTDTKDVTISISSPYAVIDSVSKGDEFDSKTGTLTVNGGQATIYITDTKPEEVTVTADFGTASDSETVRFYDKIGMVTVELNKTEVIVGEVVSVNATIKQVDGTVITVPGVTVSFSKVDPQGNVTLSAASATTDSNGVASIIATANKAGTATINAYANLKKGSALLTIVLPSLNLSLNVTQVIVGVETPVLATVTYAHNGTPVEGAVVNATGCGVNVSGTTDANGKVVLMINATSAGTITVNATKAGTNMDQETIAALAPANVNIVDFITVPETLVANESFRVNVTLNNTGGVDGTVTVTFKKDGVQFDSKVVTVPAGATAYYVESNETTFNTTGTHNITVEVDGKSKTKQVEVTALLPDLTVESINVTPESPVVNETVTVKAKIANVGDADAGAFNVRLYANDTLVGTKTVESLAAKANITVEFSWTPSEAKTYVLKVVVDTDNAVKESNETNNEMTKNIPVTKSIVDYYDKDNNERISKDEFISAFDDWMDGKISKDDFIKVFDAWMS